MNKLKKINIKKGVATVTAAVVGALTVSPVYCDGDINGQLNNVLNLVWNITTFAGIIMTALGAVQLIRCIISLTSGDQLQPGQLGKALGLLVAGIVAIALKSVLNLLGVSTTLG